MVKKKTKIGKYEIEKAGKQGAWLISVKERSPSGGLWNNVIHTTYTKQAAINWIRRRRGR